MFCQRDETGYKLLTEGVRFRSLVHGEKTHLCEFRIAKGVKVPEHSHPHEQTGYLISGRMKLIVGNESFEAGPGDSWCLPGSVPHAVQVLDDSVMVEVFSPLREDYLA
ncbi:MAG: cupin domain-containing protein [Deltaproteobacteria bacterium]|nr:cupin domain-containing protein [Deltaproteobacteria bacterium]